MVLWLKFIHLSAIAIWSAGLVCLPGLCVARTSTLGGEALYRLQAAVRYTYVVVISPAAFVAIASGIALIFARQTFEPWFSIKLAFVAALVLVHVLTGLAVIRLFDEDRAYSFPIFLVAISVTLAVIVAILALVLGKPDFVGDFLPVALGEPGGLRRLVPDFSLWPIP